MKKLLLFITSACLALVSLQVYATDLQKEKRWAAEVVDSIMDGEAVWLNDGSNKFLGIYTNAIADSTRAVIIMHGTGVHPNWQQVVQPLRVGLSEHGWNTLSIQMPVLANDVDYKEYAPLYDEVPPRIDAAIAYLRKNNIKQITLIGHSQGAVMGAYYLSKHSDKIKAFVAVGMPGTLGEGKMDALSSLKTIRLPTLDLYGSEDLESVLMSDRERMNTAKTAGNKNYSQKKIAGADHFFDGKDNELVETVSTWLNSLAK